MSKARLEIITCSGDTGIVSLQATVEAKDTEPFAEAIKEFMTAWMTSHGYVLGVRKTSEDVSPPTAQGGNA